MRVPLLLALAFSGCGLFAPEPTAMQVSGRVVAADTGEPIEGVWAFITDNRQVRVPYGPVRTGPTGRFTVFHDDGEYPTAFSLYINSFSYYDPAYGTFRANVRKGETVDLGDIPLTVRREPGGAPAPMGLATLVILLTGGTTP